MVRTLFFALFVASISLTGRIAAAADLVEVPYLWRNVAIHGGGYALDVIIHPKNPEVYYLRGDESAFRWDAAAKGWTGINDTFTHDDQYSCAALAVDPNDPSANTLYAAFGSDWEVTRDMDVYKSVDRGATWQHANLGGNKPIFVGGGAEGRWLGPRLVVDPNDSNIIYYGSQNDGLWKSVRAAANGSFTRLVSFPAVGREKYGVSSIAFDSMSDKRGDGSSLIYAAVHGDRDSNRPEGGVYFSADGGVDWQKLFAGPVNPNRITVAPDGRLWVTSESGLFTAPRGDSTLHSANFAYRCNGIAVDPDDSNHLILAGNFGVQQSINAESDAPQWKNISGFASTADDAPWRPNKMSGESITGIAFDPASNGRRAWATDWYQPWVCDDVTAEKPLWRSVSAGYEVVCVAGLASAPSGSPLFSYAADIDGFRHENVDVVPQQQLTTLGDGSGLDFCEADPNYVAHAGGFLWGQFGGGGLSTDNGRTFVPFGSGGETGLGGLDYDHRSKAILDGKVAVGSTKQQANGKPIVMLAPANDVPPMITSDWGISWKPIHMADGSKPPTRVGISYNSLAEPLAADKVDGKTFYMLCGGWASGTDFFSSTDGGQTWSKLFSWPDTGAHDTQTRTLLAQPGTRGAVWVGLYDMHKPDWGNHFARSIDGGKTFRAVAHVPELRTFSFGKPAPQRSNPTLWLLGKVEMKGHVYEGLFRSDDATASTSPDLGDASWTRVFTFGQQAVALNMNMNLTLQADRQIYGRVYVGTSGRGVWVGEPKL